MKKIHITFTIHLAKDAEIKDGKVILYIQPNSDYMNVQTAVKGFDVQLIYNQKTYPSKILSISSHTKDKDDPFSGIDYLIYTCELPEGFETNDLQKMIRLIVL